MHGGKFWMAGGLSHRPHGRGLSDRYTGQRSKVFDSSFAITGEEKLPESIPHRALRIQFRQP
jgi:hypothetical protein